MERWPLGADVSAKVGEGRCYGLVRLPDTQQPDR